MESGFAYLHPNNIFEDPSQLELEFEYSSIPFSPWRPCIPFIERHIPPVGWKPLLFRYVRVFWVFVTLPTWLGFVSLMRLLPPSITARLGNAVYPRRKGWTTWQSYTYPILSRLLWAITFGLPPHASSVTERSIPLLARLWYGRGTDMQPINVAFASKLEKERWIQDEAVDPRGEILPQDYLAAFWIRAKDGPTVESQLRKEGKGVQVVLYSVGGGYITGHPLEASRVFDIARLTKLPVLGVNYRKSVTSNRAFPAGLQDTLSGYAYLLRQGFTRIAIAGDSAGAGLSLALMQYLSRMAEKEDRIKRPEKLILPIKACFYSPWADLTFSHDYADRVQFDIIHPTMLRQAAAAYTSGLQRYPSTGDKESIGTMRRSHPFFSPALLSSVPSLKRIAEVSRKVKQQLPRFLIISGSAEVFSAECDSLCSNLREAGLEVDELKVEDEMHGPPLLPTFMSDKIAPTLESVRRFLVDA